MSGKKFFKKLLGEKPTDEKPSVTIKDVQTFVNKEGRVKIRVKHQKVEPAQEDQIEED